MINNVFDNKRDSVFENERRGMFRLDYPYLCRVSQEKVLKIFEGVFVSRAEHDIDDQCIIYHCTSDKFSIVKDMGIKIPEYQVLFEGDEFKEFKLITL